jgi:valyl-tRNA synthetase
MPTFTLPKTYDFATTEQRLYRWWEENGWFKPENSRDPDAKPFVISIPPPNEDCSEVCMTTPSVMSSISTE